MVRTIVQAIQGVVAGIGLLAIALGYLYAASLNEGGIRFVVNDTMVEIQGSTPTATAAPTATPTPAATESPATSSPQGEDEAMQLSSIPALPAAARTGYYSDVGPDLSVIVVSLGRLTRLLENPRPDEEGWHSDIAQLIEMVELGHERLLAVQPSAEAVALHEFLTAATQRCLETLDSLSGDLREIPPDLFPLVSRTLTVCTEDIKEVIRQIE